MDTMGMSMFSRVESAKENKNLKFRVLKNIKKFGTIDGNFVPAKPGSWRINKLKKTVT